MAPPALALALVQLGSCVGWQRGAVAGAAGLSVPLAQLSVRAGTALQMGPVAEKRAAAHTAFVAAALGMATAEVPPSATGQLRDSMVRAWALPWENRHKEVWWRLAVQGVRGAGGHGLAAAHACPCGGLAAGSCAEQAREHSFWSCPVAQAVVGSMQQARVAAAGGTQLPEIQRADLWLAQPPREGGSGVHQQVWLVVCLAALSAMDYGRRRLVAQHLRAQPQPTSPGGLRQLTLFQAFGLPDPAPPVSAVEVASRGAVARFWTLLADFSSVGLLPRGGQSVPTSHHPFLVRVDVLPDGGGGRLALVPGPVDASA